MCGHCKACPTTVPRAADSPQRIQSDIPIIRPLAAATSHVWNIGNQSTLLGTARHVWGEEESGGGAIPISKSVSHRHNGGSYSLSFLAQQQGDWLSRLHLSPKNNIDICLAASPLGVPANSSALAAAPV